MALILKLLLTNDNAKSFIRPNNTVKVQEQVKKQLMNIYKCNNPRCITTVE